MRHPVPSRLIVCATLLVTAVGLAACGKARDRSGSTAECNRCHGGASGNAAPPTSVDGETATTALSVGAHQAHVVAGRLRGPIACSECHVYPADMKAHEEEISRIAAGTASRVTFGALADQGVGTATWAPATAQCSNTYCHGANLNHGGTNQAPTWTTVDGSQAACGTCHFKAGDPYPSGHPTGNADCFSCHPDSVLADNATINLAGGMHLNGAIDGGCTSCHDAPPADRGHQVHAAASAVVYGDTRITADFLSPATTTYAFGCGNCHPLDFSDHAVHTTGTPSLVPIVDLSRTGAPLGSLKERNSETATYDALTGKCSGVYCHSSGQADPVYVPTPDWNDALATVGCGDCHGNPPSYDNGGAGSATANSHVGLLDFGGQLIAAGHFAGLPAALHEGSAHGGGIGTEFTGDDAAPMTCQTCHFDTTDASYTGPSGFYYWNPDGTYAVPSAAIIIDCTTCHSATPPAGNRVQPYFHVNGTRDVSFDRRTAISGTPTLPAAPNDPTRPYWYTRATTNNTNGIPSIVPAAVAGSAVTGIYLKGTTLELDLNAASWDAADKSCSSVTCHLGRLAAGSPPLKWGDLAELDALDQPTGRIDPTAVCSVCHNN